MRNTFLLLMMLVCFTSIAESAVKDVVYQGQEIEFNTKKNHTSVVIFPEKIKAILRGYGADAKDYAIQRRDSDERVLELMPLTSELAQITVSGVSGEEYVLKMLYKEDYDAKVTILSLDKALGDVNSLISGMKKEPSVPAIKAEETKLISSIAKTGAGASSRTDVLTPPDQSKSQNTQSAAHKMLAPVPSSQTLPAELNSKITLKGNGLPLKIYLSQIAKNTGYNIIANPDVEAKKASINLENIEVWRALKSLLYPFSYGFKVSKEDLIISTSETRVFDIVIPSVEQNFSDTTSNESFTNQTSTASNGSSSSGSQSNQEVKVGTKIVLENRSSNTSVWDDLESNIKSMITLQSGVYSVNKVSGQIIVTDLPGVLDRIGDFVNSYNEILKRQESYEIQIVEVELTDEYQAGIDWNALAKNVAGVANLAASTDYATNGFTGGQVFSLSAKGVKDGAGTTDNGVATVIKALEEMGRVEVVSRPRITVSNRIPCVLQEGTSKTYISESGQTINDNATTTTLKTSQVHEGLTMRLVSRIGEPGEGTILNLTASISTIDAISDIKSGNVTIQTPQVSNKSLTTNVGVMPGRSLIIGGLISTTRQDSHSGVPGLSRVPLLGNAFKYKNHKNNKTELVIVITPKFQDAK